MSDTRKNKKPNVPNLRFPGFSGEWENCTLGQLGDIKGGGTPDTLTSKYWNGGIQWFTPSEIGKTKYVYKSERTISNEGLINSSAKLLPPKSILLSSRATVGECSINLEECCTNQGFQSFVPNTLVESEFLYYRLLTHKKELIRKACGSTFLEISAKQIGSISSSIPEKREQEKILRFLSLIDERIAIQNKVIERYESLIKALNQRHFRRVQADETLKFVKLSDVLQERREYRENDGTFPHASLSKEGVDVKTDRYDRDFLVRDEDKKYKVTRFNDICYNPANLKFGVITRNKIGTLIFSPIYVTFSISENCNPEYIEYYLTEPDFIRKMLRFEQGTVYERMAVSPEDFLSECIRIPDRQSQVKHARLISEIKGYLGSEMHLLKNWLIVKHHILSELFI